MKTLTNEYLVVRSISTILCSVKSLWRSMLSVPLSWHDVCVSTITTYIIQCADPPGIQFSLTFFIPTYFRFLVKIELRSSVRRFCVWSALGGSRWKYCYSTGGQIRYAIRTHVICYFVESFTYFCSLHADSFGPDDGEYMSFGLSPDREKTFMVGADVAVAWIDKETGKGYAEDYYLDAKSQCSGQRGSCPDARLAVSLCDLLKRIDSNVWQSNHIPLVSFAGQNKFNSCFECSNGEWLFHCHVSTTIACNR